MSEISLRAKVVKTAKSYEGAKQGSKKHKAIVDKFNTVKPDGWAMTYTAAWCATFASAVAIYSVGAAYAKKYFPLSANCQVIIDKAKQLKIWKESDSYKPQAGDWILYDWEDTGKGDCKGAPNHVGIVEKATSKTITVIEGNYSKQVKKRLVPVNGKYIRGFVLPDYKGMAKEMANAKKPTGKEVVQLARKQIGNGYKKYCKAFGKNTSWCQIFMWWLMSKKGMKYPHDSFARHAAAWCRKRWPKITMKGAKAGDVVFFTSKAKGNNKMNGMVTHVGIIRKQGTSKVVYTIEGNVDGHGNWKKSKVAYKTRKLSYVWGIFRPPYKK